jgi:hypothetical protein
MIPGSSDSYGYANQFISDAKTSVEDGRTDLKHFGQ